jgi:hypothetical protein
VDDRLFLTTEDVGEMCLTSASTVRYWRAHKVGRRVLYPEDAVRAWLQALRDAGTS